ncbi:hypothetical protein HBI24_166680 [Parastagonospora nodorum]|nr:hypothetical protein HBI95_234480 [Parastagonospora nodorum]KAH5167927.1 hypothetical protein HBH77_241530 [Parastagonospora nodorum]KAH5487445.1 hypothetical protein HBI52_238090 [Parastagonospora nodorum]KAH5578280.1 hypothetical protein HBI24_166680 [Parastagonospora nodorum]KAH5597072.1 hypothetical protein HBI45_170440 [Parastagonospora nodorum]
MVRPPTATDTLVLRTASWVYWVVAQNRICTGSSSQLGSDSVFSYGFTELTTPALIHPRRLSLVATMLSPNDVSPKGKAPSIWSFDSGYGSNTLEDDEQVHLLSEPGSPPRQSVGLGLSSLGFRSNFWNVHIEDKLRLRRSESPIVPVTTRVNVFTSKDLSTNTLPVPALADYVNTCITCQLWNITNPGEGLKCDDCKSKDFVRPEELKLFPTQPKGKQAVPRLEIPQESHTRHGSKSGSKARCSACEIAYAIDPQTSAACPSCAQDPDFLSPVSPIQEPTIRRSCARRHTKLPPHALHQLRAWLKANRDHPYPNSDTKRSLAEACGITEKQVTTWFTNTRARNLPLLNDVSQGSSGDEGAYESDFSNITNTPSCTTSPVIRYDTPSSDPYYTPVSGISASNQPQLALQTSRRGKKKDYRRMNTVSPIDESNMTKTPATPSSNTGTQEQQTWQCTFCFLRLAPKSWRRHEETQHRPKHQWTCLATGPRLTISTRSGRTSICAFCQMNNPSEDHFLNSHRILECSKKSEADRTFGRPDHLRQHAKNFHKTSLPDEVRDKWRSLRSAQEADKEWLCGFCGDELATWDLREAHISNHFKDGKTMAEWKGKVESDTASMDQDRKRTLRQDHASKLLRLQESLVGQPDGQNEYHGQPMDRLPANSDGLPSSISYSNIAANTTLLEHNDTMGFPSNMLDTSLTTFDFPNTSAMDDFDALYPMHDNEYGYGIYMGEQKFSTEYASDMDIYGNRLDVQNGWQ